MNRKLENHDLVENTALIENKMNRKLENHDLVGKRRTNKRVVSFWSEEATLFSREYFHRMRCSSQRWEFNINIGDVFGRCFMNSACKKRSHCWYVRFHKSYWKNCTVLTLENETFLGYFEVQGAYCRPSPGQLLIQW